MGRTSRASGRGLVDALYEPTGFEFLSVTVEADVAVLRVSLGRPWPVVTEQVESLQMDIVKCLSIATDPRLQQRYPEIQGRKWRIHVAAEAGEPGATTLTVLRMMGSLASAAGGSLTWGVAE